MANNVRIHLYACMACLEAIGVNLQSNCKLLVHACLLDKKQPHPVCMSAQNGHLSIIAE